MVSSSRLDIAHQYGWGSVAIGGQIQTAGEYQVLLYACGHSCFFLVSIGARKVQGNHLLQIARPMGSQKCRWLVSQNRIEEARVVLENIHSRSGTDEGIDIAHAELYQIQQQVVIEKQLDSSWIHIARKPSYRKRMLLSIATTLIGQFSGVSLNRVWRRMR